MKMVKIGKDSQGGAKPVLWVLRQGLRYLTDENKLEVGGDKTSREVSIWTQSLGEPHREEIRCYRRA